MMKDSVYRYDFVVLDRQSLAGIIAGALDPLTAAANHPTLA
jgi:hypothetical protein